MMEKGLCVNMTLLIFSIVFLEIFNIISAQTEFTISTELPPATGGTPREGDVAYVLKCNIQAVNNTANITYTYVWTKDDTVLSVNNDISIQEHSGRFTVSRSSNMDTDIYQLTISSVEMQDSGLYTCYIVSNDLNLQPPSVEVVRNGMLASASETISVRYFPSEDPTCSIDTTGEVQVGRVITLSCMSSEGNPDVTLQWVGLTGGQTTKSGNIVTLEQKITVSSDTNGTIYSCSMTSPVAFPGENRMCTLAPIVVASGQSASVSVTLRTQPLSLQGESEEFQCTPDFLGSIQWSTEPVLDLSRINTIGNDVFEILDVRMSDIGTQVICEVTRSGTGAVFRGSYEIRMPITTLIVQTTQTTTVIAGATGQTSILGNTSTSLITTAMNTVGKQDGIDILLIAVVSGASGFVMLLVFGVVIVCCCCFCRRRGPKKPHPPSEYDWEGHPPSHARTPSFKPPSPAHNRGPDPIVIRNPVHNTAPEKAQTNIMNPQSDMVTNIMNPQTDILIDSNNHVNESGVSPSLLFAMKNLVDEDDVSDDEKSAEGDRLRIPRAVVREPIYARGKKTKEPEIASGSFVSRGHPLKRTPLSSLERDTSTEPLYSSADRPRNESLYAPLNGLPGQQRSHIPPDVTVTQDIYAPRDPTDVMYPGLQMPDLTVGVTDQSPIISTGESPNNTAAAPKKKKLPAGARAAIGPALSKAFTTQDPQPRPSAEISSTQDTGPMSRASPPQTGPSVAPPTYEDVTRLKAQGLINSGFQLGPTDTMVIHNTPDRTNTTENNVDKKIKYF